MKPFEEQLDIELAEIFLNKSEFALEISYRPQDDPLAAYPLDAIFNNAYEALDLAENLMATTDPHVYFRRLNLPVEILPGDEILIKEALYTVTYQREDSMGGVVVYLKECES